MSSCTQLAEVNLAGNRLSKMSENNTTQFLRLFKALLNLSVLNLAGNGLKVLPKLVFSNNEKLSYLDLSDNEFTAFSLPLTHLKNLVVLSLTSNNLNLKDKSTKWNFSGYLNKSESNKLLLAGNPIKCSKCDDLIAINWIVQNMRNIVDSSIIYCSGKRGKATLVENATVAELEDICSSIYWQQMLIIIVCSSSFVLLIVSGCVTKKLLKRYQQHKQQKEDECRLLHDVIIENEMVSVLKQEEHVDTFAVFLNFSGNDKDFVKTYIYESLNEKLKSRVGTERDLVYFSEMHMGVGKLRNVIRDGILKCKSMLFILSEGSCRPDDDNWCLFEFNTAMELQIPVILMVKEHVPEDKMDPDIREYFKSNSRIMWVKDEKDTYQMESSWDAVCSAILRSTTETVY
ncbi:toll-like receptor Tollo [Mya arenaria]|uniref:toll-like receptor Tollo n=1 Tax=Mya arenaria TaxID=6604 RepID=UPI0022E40E08|nr:toll-like receptor Tollo [Mya arenaria]